MLAWHYTTTFPESENISFGQILMIKRYDVAGKHIFSFQSLRNNSINRESESLQRLLPLLKVYFRK